MGGGTYEFESIIHFFSVELRSYKALFLCDELSTVFTHGCIVYSKITFTHGLDNK